MLRALGHHPPDGPDLEVSGLARLPSNMLDVARDDGPGGAASGHRVEVDAARTSQTTCLRRSAERVPSHGGGHRVVDVRATGARGRGDGVGSVGRV
jgi:hypothetical protein